jgi:hypothetical protein
VWSPWTKVAADEKEKVMTRFGLIGATALSLSLVLALAAPATARDAQHRAKRAVHSAAVIPDGEPNLPIENALRWGYSQGYSNYPSGFGGLYGDGRYPGNTISNKNYPTWW